jgi:lipopolysaccharide export system protein LptA
MVKEKLPAIGKALSLLLLAGTIAVVVTAFIRSYKTNKPPGVVTARPVLPGKVTTIVEGYKHVGTDKNGRETFRLLAAKDTGYDDGRHELEKVDLRAYGEPKGGEPGKSVRITSERGSYLRDQNLVTFEGNVKITSSDGMEVTTEFVRYEQQNQIASTDRPIQFRQGGISGSSVGANLNARAHTLVLNSAAHIVSAIADPKKKPAPPIEIRGDRANYAELDGVARFDGHVSVLQGERSARADQITGVINVQTKQIERVEMRANSSLKTLEKGKASELTARDVDLFFDETQHLKAATANGSARAVSLEKDSPREIAAEKIDAVFRPNEKGSDLQTIATGGRTTMKIEVAENAAGVSERVLEADGVLATFREDGRHLARADANGNAVLTVTPKQVTPKSERKRLRAQKFSAEFFATGNALKTCVAEGGAVAEFEPQMKESKLKKRTLSGRKMTANFDESIQEVAELNVEGDAKFVEGDRTATAARAVYTAANRLVALRGKPRLFDSKSRADAEEIDANLDTGESELRSRVRTTYYSRETTGGAAPFKKKGPVTIASDRALVRHNESAARYLGNVRAWQDDDFIRAENMELDNGERRMIAWGAAQSAFYDFEREVEKDKKEIVPVFASADRITYTDANRTAHYEGGVKIKQGADRIDAAVADAVMDQENRLVSMTAEKEVVMTQPARRATGEKVVYTVADDTAILTGNPAQVEDQEREGVTKSQKLTLHLRDARIEATEISDATEAGNDGKSKAKRRVRTTHRIQN